MRTAFAAIGIGIGFSALFEKLEPAWVPKAIATSLILIGIVVLKEPMRVLHVRHFHYISQ